MNDPGMDERSGNKPDEAWTAAQVIDYFLPRFERGDFYIICPDNAVTSEMDAGASCGPPGYAGQPPGPVALAP
jgi:hypothetical protein